MKQQENSQCDHSQAVLHSDLVTNPKYHCPDCNQWFRLDPTIFPKQTDCVTPSQPATVEEAATCGHVNNKTTSRIDPEDYLIQEMLGALQNSLYFIEALEDNNIACDFSGKARVKEVIEKAKAGYNYAQQPEPMGGMISLERAVKYARHQHYRGSIQEPFVEFNDWSCKPEPMGGKSELIAFASYIVGHDEETIQQMYDDWSKHRRI